MTDAELRSLVAAYIEGDLSEADLGRLQDELRASAGARALFREQMDLEASLRTWAEADATEAPAPTRAPWRPVVASGAIAAALALVILGAWLWFGHASPESPGPRTMVASLGTIRTQAGAVWADGGGAVSSGTLRAADYALAEGVAEFSFASGTSVVLEAPSRIRVLSSDAARLLDGNVVVHVSELSDGFLLETPEASIRDEGTEYAVSLEDDSTEVHVFDGAVLWQFAETPEEDSAERIEAGEARRYSRRDRGRGKRVPFGQRQFVRQLEAQLRAHAGEALLAYDGFENLAGRLRRGRSGFGWSEGWRSGRRGRGPIGEIIESPDDVAFGVARTGRRQLRLAGGRALGRALESPLSAEPGDVSFVSVLVRRTVQGGDGDRLFSVSLGQSGGSGRRRAGREVAFGVGSDALPYLKAGGTIARSAPALAPGADRMFVVRLAILEDRTLDVRLRVFESTEELGRLEPRAWTVELAPVAFDFELARVRLAAGANVVVDFDELRVGKTWAAVTAARGD